MGFIRIHPISVVVAPIALRTAGYVLFDFAFAPGTDFDPVMR